MGGWKVVVWGRDSDTYEPKEHTAYLASNKAEGLGQELYRQKTLMHKNGFIERTEHTRECSPECLM